MPILLTDPTRRLSGGVATLIRPRPRTGTEADWQTVTTDYAFGSAQRDFMDSLAKGTGSSLADVSDASEDGFYPHEHGSTERIIQHPQYDANPGSYHIRNDKRMNFPVLVPKFRDPKSEGFPKNSSRKLISPPNRAVDTLRRFSNAFHHDTPGYWPSKQGRLHDLDTRLDSYQSLDSDLGVLESGFKEVTPTPICRPGKSRFRWSRIRENLGRDPPKTPLTIFDQPLYRGRIVNRGESKKSSHVPHDDFLAQIPRLPFPLISLPEAAMLQSFRRLRGDEDHTDPSNSFAGRGRSNTISTISSSNFPTTPPSGRFDLPHPSPSRSIPRPAPVHRKQRRHDSSERVANVLLSSSAILATPPPSDPRAPGDRSWYRGLPRDGSAFYGRLPRTRGFSSSTTSRRTKHVQAGYTHNEGSLITGSETDLIQLTRNDPHLRYRPTREEDKREKLIFLGIMTLTIFFPFIGLLALLGKFDSAVCWLTHGDMNYFTSDQRGILKQQLFVEVVLYPVLIIILAVYYSVHK
ncbi:Fc.00g016920.m01.CDS01 [Cosmosporella sp. VM-42]